MNAAEDPRQRRRIAVTGATGTVGRRAVAALAPRYPVRSLTRDPEAAARAGVAGELVRADFADRHALRQAITGSDALLLITTDPFRPEHDENLLQVARDEGVRQVVKLSALAVTDPQAQDLITRWQRECEDLVRACGMEWTLLQPRSFMSNTLGWATTVRAEGVVRAVYGTSRNACVDPADVAAAAAHVLTTPGHAGQSYALTGPRPISAQEQTEDLARALGKPLKFEELTPDQAWELWSTRFPEPVAHALAQSAERQQAGAKEGVADGIRRTIGHGPTSFADWAFRNVSRFR